MRAKALQFGKAISAALFVLLLVVVGSKNALAQYQAATLQHEGNITAFYGPDALANAHAAAAIGDTITLSSGNFNGCLFTKAITVHGAGCSGDTVSGTSPTKVSTSYIEKGDATIPLVIEGIWFSFIQYNNGANGSRNICFNKCFIDEFKNNNYSITHKLFNSQFNNCIIKSFKYHGSGLTFVNSVVSMAYYDQLDMNYQNLIYNSIMLFNNGVKATNTMTYNSIIVTTDNNNTTNSTFYNCIGIELGNTSLFEGQLNSTNMEVTGYENVFEAFNGTVTYDNNYQLKEDIATTFLGNDGTEVGIYGGMLPYNTRRSYMIRRRCNVAGRTTVDDKLSVEIELNIDE